MKQEFVQEGMRTYLKIEGDDLENVGDKMFSYQTIPGFVPMEIEWVDEKKQYVYDVTGKLNLKQYLEKDGIGKHKVKKVMECLLSLPERLESYLLDGNDVRILPDCIFVDKHSEEVYGIYYPGNDCYGMTAYAAVAEFIIDHMNQKDTELAFFVYGLHKRFLEEGMTLVALREYMDSDSHVETDFAKEEEKKDSLIYQAKSTPDKEFLPFKKGHRSFAACGSDWSFNFRSSGAGCFVCRRMVSTGGFRWNRLGKSSRSIYIFSWRFCIWGLEIVAAKGDCCFLG